MRRRLDRDTLAAVILGLTYGVGLLIVYVYAYGILHLHEYQP